MRKVNLMLISLLLTMMWVFPVFAEEIGLEEPQPTQTVTQAVQTQTVQPVTTYQGGVQPISPDKLQGKIDTIEGWIIELMSPIIHLLSKLSLILVVLLLLVAVFVRKAFSKAFILTLSVVAAVAIFSNVSGITNTIQWLGQWLGQ